MTRRDSGICLAAKCGWNAYSSEYQRKRTARKREAAQAAKQSADAAAIMANIDAHQNGQIAELFDILTGNIVASEWPEWVGITKQDPPTDMSTLLDAITAAAAEAAANRERERANIERLEQMRAAFESQIRADGLRGISPTR